jgi:DnaJ-class molecular chaperone
MGFDVYGMNPTVADGTVKPTRTTIKGFGRLSADEKKERIKAIEEYQEKNVGSYFRNNVWWWRPLWKFVCNTCADILSRSDMNAGQYNDGHEISEDKALKISKRLREMVANGFADKWSKDRKDELDNMELERCDLCDGTGHRKEPPERGAGTYMECNACHGKGEKEAFETHYPFSVENVERFAAFCKDSGGFSIC